MTASNKSLIVTILAIIGAFVVLKWVIKLTFGVLMPLLLVAVVVVVILALMGKKR